MSLSMIGVIVIYTKNCRTLNNVFNYEGKEG